MDHYIKVIQPLFGGSMSGVTCRSCGKTKPIEEFNKHLRNGPLEPWNVRRCKDCAHNEYVDRYSKPSSRKALMDASNDWKKRNPERHAALNQAHRARYPERVVAQNRLAYAIRKGNVVRQPCEICGTIDRVHGHHVSYRPEDWYNVKWLCHVCHRLEHME